MDPRTFLAGTGAVLLATPLGAGAQQAGKVYRIGVLSTGGPEREVPSARTCTGSCVSAGGSRARPSSSIGATPKQSTSGSLTWLPSWFGSSRI